MVISRDRAEYAARDAVNAIAHLSILDPVKLEPERVQVYVVIDNVTTQISPARLTYESPAELIAELVQIHEDTVTEAVAVAKRPPGLDELGAVAAIDAQIRDELAADDDEYAAAQE